MFLILFGQFALFFQRFPNGKAGFRVHLFDAVVEVGNGRSVGVVLVGTGLHHFLVAAEFGIAADVGFVDET